MSLIFGATNPPPPVPLCTRCGAEPCEEFSRWGTRCLAKERIITIGALIANHEHSIRDLQCERAALLEAAK